MKLTSLAVALVAAVCCTQTALAGLPASLHLGSRGGFVAALEQNLHASQRRDFYKGAFDGDFGPLLSAGLKSWQKLAGYPVTGTVSVGSRQWNQLRREATVSRLPPGVSQVAVKAAIQNGWSVDASKTTYMLYLLYHDSKSGLVKVALASPTSFGGCNSDGCFVTPEGAFTVCRKAGPNEVSHTWKDAAGNPAPMPWAVYMYIGGRCSGTAIHQDPLGNSHQCVHVPSMQDAEFINQHMPIGSLVVIHR